MTPRTRTRTRKGKTMAPRETREQKIARLGYEYKKYRREAESAAALAEAKAQELLKLVPVGASADDLQYDQFSVRVTHVQKYSEYLDETTFTRGLSLKTWNKVSRRVLDQDLLAKAIENGLVDESWVQTCTSSTPQKPYPLVTLKPTSL